jgi:hypothetical protein
MVVNRMRVSYAFARELLPEMEIEGRCWLQVGPSSLNTNRLRSSPTGPVDG